MLYICFIFFLPHQVLTIQLFLGFSCVMSISERIIRTHQQGHPHRLYQGCFIKYFFKCNRLHNQLSGIHDLIKPQMTTEWVIWTFLPNYHVLHAMSSIRVTPSCHFINLNYSFVINGLSSMTTMLNKLSLCE